jgi:hypothetical protein
LAWSEVEIWAGLEGGIGEFTGNRLQQDIADNVIIRVIVKTCQVGNKLFQYSLFFFAGNLIF